MNKILRMKIMISLILLSFSHASLAAPAYALPKLTALQSLLKRTNNGNRNAVLHVIEGQRFTISLDCQPSSGYTWYITEPALEDTIQLLGKTIIPYRCPDGRAKATFIFKALNPGQEFLTFEYARPWGWSSAQRCTYTIIIHEKYKPTKEYK
jgi:predicted secreted protein